MNFFFHTSNSFLSSRLTIPKFQNSGKYNRSMCLFQADIIDGCWCVTQTDCVEDEDFWVVECSAENKNSIYFLATYDQLNDSTLQNELINLNNFTDTSPDYRANLEISNSRGATSSYQSEYPFGMTKKIASLYSDCGMLTSSNADKVGVFLRNIHFKPSRKSARLFLFDNNKDVLLETFEIFLNETCYIDLTKFKSYLATCFIFAKDYIGIPIFVNQYVDGQLSFEHTHPPHELIHGKNRFIQVNRLKARAYEKIS